METVVGYLCLVELSRKRARKFVKSYDKQLIQQSLNHGDCTQGQKQDAETKILGPRLSTVTLKALSACLEMITGPHNQMVYLNSKYFPDIPTDFPRQGCGA